jgi:16S rRNA processing protein RimM
LRCESRNGSSTIRITSVRPHKDRFLIRIEGVDDANAAEAYAGATLYASRDKLDVNEGEYLDVDLIGCKVVGVDGKEHGKVGAVEHYPASDMLVVNNRMIPMVHAIVKNIDMATRRITVDPPLGLLEDVDDGDDVEREESKHAEPLED